MNAILITTDKLYYDDFYRSRCAATVVKTGGDFVELDATVAYPEGGGQEADTGLIHMADGTSLRFVGARKMYGSAVELADIPDIQAGGVIQHLVAPEDREQLGRLSSGMRVEVAIDVERRARLSLSHTAAHLLYIAIGVVRPDAIAGVLGCHIKPDGARFDFKVQERFTEAQLKEVADIANGFVSRHSPIRLYAHADVSDARFWECEGHVIPCGGTHITDAGPVGSIQLKRKNLGAGKERISCTFEQASYDLDRYHP